MTAATRAQALRYTTDFLAFVAVMAVIAQFWRL